MPRLLQLMSLLAAVQIRNLFDIVICVTKKCRLYLPTLDKKIIFEHASRWLCKGWAEKLLKNHWIYLILLVLLCHVRYVIVKTYFTIYLRQKRYRINQKEINKKFVHFRATTLYTINIILPLVFFSVIFVLPLSEIKNEAASPHIYMTGM